MAKKGPTPRRKRQVPSGWNTPFPGGALNISSGIRPDDKQPFLQLDVGNYSQQMSADDAVTLALNILREAEAARYEAALLIFLMDRYELPLNGGVAMIADLRDFITTAPLFPGEFIDLKRRDTGESENPSQEG